MDEKISKMGYKLEEIRKSVSNKVGIFVADTEVKRSGVLKQIIELNEKIIEQSKYEENPTLFLTRHLMQLSYWGDMLGVPIDSSKEHPVHIGLLTELRLNYSSVVCDHPFRFPDGECVVCNKKPDAKRK